MKQIYHIIILSSLAVTVCLGNTNTTSSANRERWKQLSTKERAEIRKRYRHLSKEEMMKLKEKMEQFKKLSKEEQKRIRDNQKRFDSMSRERRRAVGKKYERFRRMPEGRRRAMRNRMRELRMRGGRHSVQEAETNRSARAERQEEMKNRRSRMQSMTDEERKALQERRAGRAKQGVEKEKLTEKKQAQSDQN